MDYLAMAENAINMHNLSPLLMPESYQGGVEVSLNCNQQGNILVLDSTILSCCLFFVMMTEIVYAVAYNEKTKRGEVP